MKRTQIAKRSIVFFASVCLVVGATSAPEATTTNFPGFVADPTTYGVNVFLDTAPFTYGSIGFSKTPYYQPMVSSSFDTKTDENGTRSARALLTPSNFDLGVLATTSKRGAFVRAAAVATTGYFVSEAGSFIQGTATIHGTFRGTPNQGGLGLQFFLEDYHQASSPRAQTLYRTYVEMIVTTQDTYNGTRPPLNFDKVSCLSFPSDRQPDGYKPCPIDIEQDHEYGDFTVTVPFAVAGESGNGILAELNASAFSSGGEEETVDFLGTASLSIQPPPGTVVTLATGQKFGVASDATPPVLTLPTNLTAEATSSAGAAVTYTASASDDVDGSVAVTCTPASGATFPLGTTIVDCSASDAAGNVARGSFTVTVRDTIPPSVTCSATPSVLWPPNGRMVPISVDVSVGDSGSGAAGFVLTSVTSDEPGPAAIQGFAPGAASASGQLAASRLGSGSGRTYALTYTGYDAAGNSATCQTTVSVPHDQGKH